jgi:hypothetical protein
MLIQKQLRGIGRFVYTVSKENFVLAGLDNPSLSNTGGFGVFHCRGISPVTAAIGGKRGGLAD